MRLDVHYECMINAAVCSLCIVLCVCVFSQDMNLTMKQRDEAAQKEQLRFCVLCCDLFGLPFVLSVPGSEAGSLCWGEQAGVRGLGDRQFGVERDVSRVEAMHTHTHSHAHVGSSPTFARASRVSIDIAKNNYAEVCRKERRGVAFGIFWRAQRRV